MGVDHPNQYENLLFNYAIGLLDEAQHLIISSHIMMSARAREIVRSYEQLGGELLERECNPVKMRDCSLDKVLAHLDEEPEPEKHPCFEYFTQGMDLPDIITHYLALQRRNPAWKNLYPGIKTYELALKCKQSRARFLKAEPERATPTHTHRGSEITLILEGAFSDQGKEYYKGELIIRDENDEHTPKACPERGCVCLMVSSKPVRLTGKLARLLNPFIKI